MNCTCEDNNKHTIIDNSPKKEGEISREVYVMGEKLDKLFSKIKSLDKILEDSVLRCSNPCDNKNDDEKGLASNLGRELRSYNDKLEDITNIVEDIIDRVEL